MIQLKTSREIATMREAGLVVAEGLRRMAEAVTPGISTAEVDRVGARVLAEAGATSNFLNYHGFPAVACISVNDEIVHGIPREDHLLADGDVVTIDFGAIIDGWHGDAALSVGVGEISAERQALLTVCEDSLWAGLAAVRAGGRLTDISAAVEGYVRPHGYGIIEGYGGHGIGTEMHQDPHVPNVGRAGRGPKLVEGICLAIEPMITLGTHHTRTLADDWTVVSTDGSAAAHFEHTIALTPDGPLVTTAVDGGAARLGQLAGSARA